MNKKDWLLHLTIEGINQEQAEKLLDIIIDYAESLHTFIGGGIAPLEDTDDEQTKGIAGLS